MPVSTAPSVPTRVVCGAAQVLVRRLLAEDGWRVVPLAWFEWALMHTEEEQLAWVCSALEAAGVRLS